MQPILAHWYTSIIVERCCKLLRYLFGNKFMLPFISDVNWLKGANEHSNNQINTQNCI